MCLFQLDLVNKLLCWPESRMASNQTNQSSHVYAAYLNYVDFPELIFNYKYIKAYIIWNLISSLAAAHCICNRYSQRMLTENIYIHINDSDKQRWERYRLHITAALNSEA